MKQNNLLYKIILCTSLAFLSCTALTTKKDYKERSDAEYSIYLVNKNIHTGLIIPVNSISMSRITALEYFTGSEYADFGWGEEVFYQKPGAKYCLGVKAVTIPSSSVMRVEGFSNLLDQVIRWSDYAVEFRMTGDEFIKLCDYIDDSFKRDESRKLIETSRKRDGAIIFFKSIYLYHMFNTCNTWVARALESSGLDVSPLFVITAENLYDEVRGKCIIHKGE